MSCERLPSTSTTWGCDLFPTCQRCCPGGRQRDLCVLKYSVQTQGLTLTLQAEMEASSPPVTLYEAAQTEIKGQT